MSASEVNGQHRDGEGADNNNVKETPKKVSTTQNDPITSTSDPPGMSAQVEPEVEGMIRHINIYHRDAPVL
jgi:hypothetical protein